MSVLQSYMVKGFLCQGFYLVAAGPHNVVLNVSYYVQLAVRDTITNVVSQRSKVWNKNTLLDV